MSQAGTSAVNTTVGKPQLLTFEQVGKYHQLAQKSFDMKAKIPNKQKVARSKWWLQGKKTWKLRDVLREIREGTRAMKQNQDVRRLEQSKQKDTLRDMQNNSTAQPEQKWEHLPERSGQCMQNQGVHPEGPTVEFYKEKVNGKKSKAINQEKWPALKNRSFQIKGPQE